MTNQEITLVIEDLIKLSGGKHIKTPPPTDSLIESYQKDIGFLFSDEYKFFLKNASTIFYGTKDPLIITQDKSSRSELSNAIFEGRRIGLPNDWLPICEDNGDYYCIIPDGTVRFWTSNGSSDEKWPNLGSWIRDVWMSQG
ncbi:SMI1/KNR4 family protein [Serratia fonticola]|uniref:SMI1/KNR4 family protein n=1 Tax=Serratia fonticola TaxID=47917 RepID=UPI00217872EB|nr:SMI1/KNR4 family protein [Serratia fonticola]CAI1728712.1 SMI1 / KNR4 family [Serratia fonticola]